MPDTTVINTDKINLDREPPPSRCPNIPVNWRQC